MPPETAMSHHYRICEFGGWECLKKPSTIDKTGHKWAKDLFPAVKAACDAIFGGPCPKAPPLGSPW